MKTASGAMLNLSRQPVCPNTWRGSQRRGAAAILAMMFMVIFSSLAAAMAIVAQGNLATADSHMKVSRALISAETGLRFMAYQLSKAALNVETTAGKIEGTVASNLWDEAATAITDELDDGYTVVYTPGSKGPLRVLDVQVDPAGGMPPFSITMTPDTTDKALIHARIEATDGQAEHALTRAIEVDFRLDKKIRYAILSRSRIMIGRNVMVDGPIGSRFMETNLQNGHPVQMESDFRGLDAALDAELSSLVGTLVTNDLDGDNRININSTEATGIANPASLDTNGDGYIDDYDFFLAHYDTNGDKSISRTELNVPDELPTDPAADVNTRYRLFELIDTFGSIHRAGYGDGVINELDDYGKIHGEIRIAASEASWESGAASVQPDGSPGGSYQDYFQGSIVPGHHENPLQFSSPDPFEPDHFDTSSYRDMATGNLASQAAAGEPWPAGATPSVDASGTYVEEVPFAAPHPYDFYRRTVYRNITFRNVKIPKGTNALFINCKFIGVTFVETETRNADARNFNFAGMWNDQTGTVKYPSLVATVNGTTVADTKPLANNLRFHSCNFEGSVVSDVPQAFSHVRNKASFTGTTRFANLANIEESPDLNALERDQLSRSTILMPNFSVEMGTYVSPHDSTETVNLSGAIVAGILDVRGNARIDGTVITTFQPESSEDPTNPVVGQTSPQFNTTLGYFPSSAGDLEAEMPAHGLGMIQLRYNPTLPLPDGIYGPIQILPQMLTYRETN